MANRSDNIVGGVLGLALAWLLWGRAGRLHPIRDMATEIAAYESMVTSGELDPTDLPAVIDMIAAGATAVSVRDWVGQRAAMYAMSRHGTMQVPSAVSVTLPVLPPLTDISRPPEPDCYSDNDCYQKYGPDFYCIKGVCVHIPPPPPWPPEDDEIPAFPDDDVWPPPPVGDDFVLGSFRPNRSAIS